MEDAFLAGRSGFSPSRCAIGGADELRVAASAASAAADPASIGHLVALADEVAKASGNADYRLVANTGAGAGQTVFHTHLHVLGGSSRMTESLI